MPSSFLPTTTPYADGGWVGSADLLAQRGDVVTSLTQRVRQLLVAGDGLRQLTLGLQQALLERAHPLRRLGPARARRWTRPRRPAPRSVPVVSLPRNAPLCCPSRSAACVPEHTRASRVPFRGNVRSSPEHDTAERCLQSRRFSTDTWRSVPRSSNERHGFRLDWRRPSFSRDCPCNLPP